MSSTRKPIDLGGSVARNDARVESAVKPPPPARKPPREATRTTTVRIRESLHLKLKYYCLDHDTSLQEIFESYLDELLKDTPDRRGG